MQEVVGVLAVLASNDHGWFWFLPLIPLFWLLLFFVFFRLFFWRGRRGPWGPYRQAAPDPRTILAERYARGEITNDEGRERLRSGAASPTYGGVDSARPPPLPPERWADQAAVSVVSSIFCPSAATSWTLARMSSRCAPTAPSR